MSNGLLSALGYWVDGPGMPADSPSHPLASRIEVVQLLDVKTEFH